jgi:hypothetical protein
MDSWLRTSRNLNEVFDFSLMGSQYHIRLLGDLFYSFLLNIFSSETQRVRRLPLQVSIEGG